MIHDFFNLDIFKSPVIFAQKATPDPVETNKRSGKSEQPDRFSVRLGAVGIVTASLLFAAPGLTTSPELTARLGIDHDVTLSHVEDARFTTVSLQIRDLRRTSPDLGNGPPSEEAATQALAWTDEMVYQADLRGLPWVPPHVAASAFGETVFEWWAGKRKLTMYFDGTDVDFVRVAGPDIDADMKDGHVKSVPHWTSLWQWLQKGLRA